MAKGQLPSANTSEYVRLGMRFAIRQLSVLGNSSGLEWIAISSLASGLTVSTTGHGNPTPQPDRTFSFGFAT